MEREICDIGLIGLAVMGQNLVLNMNDHGYRVAVFNRTVSKVDEFIHNEAAGTRVVGTHSIEEFVQALKRPRRAMLMVKAGSTVDEMIADSAYPTLKRAISSSMAATRITRTRIAVPRNLRKRESSSSGPAYRVVKKERDTVPRSCRAGIRLRGRT